MLAIVLSYQKPYLPKTLREIKGLRTTKNYRKPLFHLNVMIATIGDVEKHNGS